MRGTVLRPEAKLALLSSCAEGEEEGGGDAEGEEEEEEEEFIVMRRRRRSSLSRMIHTREARFIVGWDPHADARIAGSNPSARWRRRAIGTLA